MWDGFWSFSPYRVDRRASLIAVCANGRSVQCGETSSSPLTVRFYRRSPPRERLFERGRRVLDTGCGEPVGFTTRLVAVLVLLAGVFLSHAAPAGAACPDSPRAGVDWSGCDKRHLHLKGENLSAAILSGADLSRSDFLKATLRGSVLSGANLSRARFDSADLREANLSQAHAYRARFRAANLLGASLAEADLHQTDFGRANLQQTNGTEANFQEASLREANLRQADLRRSNLMRADLRDATLAGAHLEGANVYRARVEGTDLSETLGISEAQIGEACGDAATRLPDGVEAPARWPCPASE